MVIIGAPNFVHCEICLKAAAAGKHIVVEKPFCLNMAEADQMIEACKTAGVKLMYAEELCFTPKYVRLKSLLDEGALGKPIIVESSRRSMMVLTPAHFWDVERSGGGVTMDMGCHAFQFFRFAMPTYTYRTSFGGVPINFSSERIFLRKYFTTQ